MKVRAALALIALLLSALAGKAAPFITSFTPTFGSSGDLTDIFIHGSGFYPGVVVVKFNNVEASVEFATLTDGTEIEAHVAPGTPLGPGSIFVSVNGSSTLSGDTFTVIGPGPYISGFSPSAG